MNIVEHAKLIGDNPPLPNQIMNLEDVYKIKFYNTSYREYLGVYGGYIIGVYPFAIKTEKTFRTDDVAITYDFFKLMGVRSSHHHIDFKNGEIDIDPCDIYESVSGVRIHHGGSDSHLMNLDHTNEIKLFESEIVSISRDNKLNELGI